MTQKKFVVTGILVFDFELFIGGRCALLGHKGRFVLVSLYIRCDFIPPFTAYATEEFWEWLGAQNKTDK